MWPTFAIVKVDRDLLVHTIGWVFLNTRFLWWWERKYRLDQQCCPGGNHPETTRSWSLNCFAKSLVIPTIHVLIKVVSLFHTYGWNYQWFTKKSGDDGWSADNFRRENIAGPHGTYFLMKIRSLQSSETHIESPLNQVLEWILLINRIS